MLIKPAERRWLRSCRPFIEGFLGGALSVLVPGLVIFGLMLGFTVN